MSEWENWFEVHWRGVESKFLFIHNANDKQIKRNSFILIVVRSLIYATLCSIFFFFIPFFSFFFVNVIIAVSIISFGTCWMVFDGFTVSLYIQFGCWWRTRQMIFGWLLNASKLTRHTTLWLMMKCNKNFDNLIDTKLYVFLNLSSNLKLL